MACSADMAAASSAAEAREMLQEQVTPLGFTAFNYGCVNFADSLISTMDPEWIAGYHAQELWRTDPLVQEARRRVTPFLFSEVFVGPASSSAEARMRQAIAEAPAGIVVPIHCPRVGASLASFLTDMPQAELERRFEDLAGRLALLAGRFHEAVVRFYIHGRGTDTKAGLTTREREVLTLASQGKSSREISQILGISAATCNNHIGRLLRKFGVSSRAQAVALALQTGQLDRLH